MEKEQNILVIGGTGFIGEEVVKRLGRENGIRVRVLHSRPLSTVTPSKALYIRMNATVPNDSFASLVQGSDTVFLLAQPDARIVENVLMAVATATPHIIYASTGLLYKGGDAPQSEEAELEAVTEYERKKLTEEEMLREFARANLTARVTIARLGNVYGGHKNRGIVGLLVNSLKTGKETVIAGDGSQVRDFVHVRDVAEAFARLVQNDAAENLRVVNVATGVGASLKDVLAALERITGKKVPHSFGPSVEETQSVIGNNEKLSSMLGWKPSVDLETGLRETWDLHRVII